MARVVLLGLDGLCPEFLRQWADELPNLMKMQKRGIWGVLESAVPPALPQVWISTQSGRNPGAYGIWDFTYRDDFSYGEKNVVSSEVTRRVDLLYTILPKKMQRVAMINVPATWPSPKIPAGYVISGLITPNLDLSFTYPENLKDEVYQLVGEYIIDLTEADVGGKEVDKGRVLQKIYEMDSQRFVLTKYFINEKNCDCVMTAVMGCTRMLSLFYRGFNSQNRQYTPDPHYEGALHDYYLWIDKNIGELYQNVPKETVLFIYSGYSAKELQGRINLNEWLMKEGYMSLLEQPQRPTSFKDVEVDWFRTKCWSTGYTGKLYLNMKGREPQGTVDPKDYDKFLGELTAKLKGIADKGGKPLNTQVWQPGDICFGPYVSYGPDLLVDFDEGRLGTSELVGHDQERIYSFDTAKDCHDVAYGLCGYFVITGPGIPEGKELKGVSLLNIAPTVLDVLDIPTPRNMERPSILPMVKKEVMPSPEETDKKVASRLKFLGY
jgi:predicted AlkP superfamily phosphohydrolase/phosphomutase